MKGPAGGEECKGGRCWRSGVGAMGYGFMCRETWWRDWSLALRGDLHPWRGGTGEDNLAGSGLVCWTGRSRHKMHRTCRFGRWIPKWASRGVLGGVGVKEIPPLEVPVWEPLVVSAPASGDGEAGRMEAPVVAMIQICHVDWLRLRPGRCLWEAPRP